MLYNKLHNVIEKNNTIKLNEAQLRKVIRESIKKVLREAHGEPEQYPVNIYDGIIESYKAQEIAEQEGLSSEEEGAAAWFNGVAYEGEFKQEMMPKHHKFIETLDCGDLYYDYGADYYFLVEK